MKTTILNFKRFFIAVTVAFAALTISTTANAASKEPDSSKPVSIQYLGTVNGQPLFQVDIKNEMGEALTVSLSDFNGEKLYSENVNETSFSKRIRLATTETEISLSLYVYSAKTKKTQVYEINKVTRQTDDMVVNQVKF
jgi:hypothetical protein